MGKSIKQYSDINIIKKETYLMENNNLLLEIRERIKESKSKAVAIVNSVLSMLYWQIGKKISKEILEGKRAEF